MSHWFLSHCALSASFGELRLWSGGSPYEMCLLLLSWSHQIKNSKGSPRLPVLGSPSWFISTLLSFTNKWSFTKYLPITYTECTQFIFAWTLAEIGLLSSGILSLALMWPYASPCTKKQKVLACEMWHEEPWEVLCPSKIMSSVLPLDVKLTSLKSV